MARHESGQLLPPLTVALSYAIFYRTSVDELFAGLREEVEGVTLRRAEKLLRSMERGSSRAYLDRLVAEPDIYLVPCEE